MAVAMAKRLKGDRFDLSLTLLLSKDPPGVHLVEGGARARASYFNILEPWDPDDKAKQKCFDIPVALPHQSGLHC